MLGQKRTLVLYREWVRLKFLRRYNQELQLGTSSEFLKYVLKLYLSFYSTNFQMHVWR